MEKTCLHVYCGDGKGKTTASVGLAIRAAGAGKRVLFVQFMKGNDTAELNILKEIANIEILRPKKEYPFFKQMDELQKKEIQSEHDNIIDTVEKRVHEKAAEVVILDELTYPINYGIIQENKVYTLLKLKEAEYVVTGRDPSPELVSLADYVTEMKKIKHPFDQGAVAREGIEF